MSKITLANKEEQLNIKAETHASTLIQNINQDSVNWALNRGNTGRVVLSLAKNDSTISDNDAELLKSMTTMDSLISNNTTFNIILNSYTAMSALARSKFFFTISNNPSYLDEVIDNPNALKATVDTASSMKYIATSGPSMQKMVNSSLAKEAMKKSALVKVLSGTVSGIILPIATTDSKSAQATSASYAGPINTTEYAWLISSGYNYARSVSSTYNNVLALVVELN